MRSSLLLLLLLLTGCAANRSLKTKLAYPEFSNTLPKLDTTLFKNHVAIFNLEKGRDTIFEDGDTIIKSGTWRTYQVRRNSRLTYKLNRHMGGPEPWGFSEEIYLPGNLYLLDREFYGNGDVKSAGLRSVYGYRAGKWTYYNPDGSVEKVEDQDADFKVDIAKAISYCNKLGVPLISSNTSLLSTSIGKVRHKNKWILEIIYFDGSTAVMLKLDAKSGKVVEGPNRNIIVTRH